MKNAGFSVLVVLAAGCGSKTETPKAWWEAADACPAGGTIARDGSSVFCASADGLRNGRFETLADDGETALLTGEYRDGKRHGTWTQRSASGTVLGSYELRDGSGQMTTWSDGGQVVSQADLVGDVRHGSWVKYHPVAGGADPVRAEEGRFDGGKAVGRWVFRDPTSAVTREVDYRDGEVWETRTYEGGALAKTELSDAAVAERAAAKTAALEAVKNGGIPGMSSKKGGAFASLTGTADFDENVYGGLSGFEVGEMQGGFGFGIKAVGKGTGSGGDRLGWGTIGTTGGSVGRGGGHGSGYRRDNSTSRTRIGAAKVTGSLDKNIISRYVRRKLPAIGRCYETAVLSGKLVAQFTILESGAVSATRVSGLGDARVESCVRKIVAAIQFPRPKKGVVSVSVPFMLSPG